MKTEHPYHECPRYFQCNVNKCPLHPSYPRLVVDDEDRDHKCTLEKQVRFRIGTQYPDVLKWQGLTSREWTGKVKFESLSESERQVIREMAKKHLSLACQSEIGKHEQR